MDIPEQLAELRRRVAQIDAKYSSGAAPAPRPKSDPLSRAFIEDLISGQIIETAWGSHFETEKLYERHRRHGSMDISNLAELPDDLLDALSEGAIPRCHPAKWAFLDTETTGLAGGSGTYAFLVGVGSIDDSGFRVRQFFMRDFADERSMLSSLAHYLEPFDVLVTYNGKAFDQPLLETRFRMTRVMPPFGRMEHLDLLYGARRLWKLRLESCRLVELENRILGVEREGDVPGELIPFLYFDYLRTRVAFRLVPVLHHNVMDIVSLACLTGVVPFAFRAPHRVQFRHGADLVGLARWLVHGEKIDEALGLFRRAVELGLPDPLLFRTLWDIGLLEKKRERIEAALGVWTELAGGRNPYRVPAFEELAKHYEHRERNYAMALEMTCAARGHEDTAELRRREQRLRQRIAGRSRTLPLA